MKLAKWERILAILVALTMMMSMMLVFTVSGNAQAGAKQYVLDVADLTPFAAGAKYNGEYEVAGTENYFTVFYSEKTKVETNEKSFADGTSASKRIAWGDKSTIGVDLLNVINFKTQGSATIKLWWVGGDANRYPAIYDSNGNVIAQYNGTTVKNDLYVTELTVDAKGSYYLGNIGGSNYFYQIQVTDRCDGEPDGPRGDWSSVPAADILSAIDNGDGTIRVEINGATIDHNGPDEHIAYMYNAAGDLVSTRATRKENTGGFTFTFKPTDSGTYKFIVETARAGEASKFSSEVTTDFTYLLQAPYISSATSQGGGSIEVKWNAVHEAAYYNIYVNGTLNQTVDGSKTAYTVSGLTIGSEYSLVVAAVRGGEEIKSSPMSAVASAEAKQTWGFTAYGPSTNEDNNGYIGSVNDDGYVTVYSENGKGKIQPNSVDGVAFYYTAIPTEYNFTLRAKVTVDSWTLSNGQEGFGLLATDRLGTNGDKSNIWNNSYLAGSTKIEYRYNGDTDEIVNIATQNTTLTKYSMKLGIGTIARTGVTPENLALLEAMDTETINTQFKTVTTTLDRTAADIVNLGGSYNVIGNFTTTPSGTFDERFLITEYIMEIQKNNSGYFISYYDVNGNLIAQNKNYDPDALSHLDQDFVYAGFFASRNARATFSDIELTTILASEDAEREYPPTTYITPTVTVNSGSVTTNENYELIVDPNVSGTITIKYDGQVIAENVELDMGERFRCNILLTRYDENAVKIEFTPDPYQWLGDYTELSSTRTVHVTQNVMFNRGNYHRKTLYISPDVLPYTTTADGTKENPFDIYTAVENAYPGQTLILMEGTYKMSSSLKIQRGMDGTADAMIRLIADPEAATRPVLDFQGLYTGIVHAGDYWYFYGFDVTGSMNKTKGFQISGNYNVLDQIHAYLNGDTGIQICRLASSDLYPDWPCYNLILNCTSFYNFDEGFEDADGFAAKLTVGDGNVFDGCVAYNNADDGWDLYAKVDTGSIGAVTIRNSIAYDNGWIPGHSKTGNGNGFKLGGDSLSGHHILENCIAFNNLAKGIDSNSCPDIIVINSISFNNGGSNVAFYTNNSENTDFSATGVISFRTDKLDVAENLRGKGSQDTAKYNNATTYYWDGANSRCVNTLGVEITADMFVSLVFEGWTRNADGSINLGGFLEIKANVPENGANCKLGSTASTEIVLLEDEECSFSRAWYTLDKNAHWHLCECGNKSQIGAHEFIWITDKPIVDNQPGLKHQECSICGYKKAAIETYPEKPSTPPVEDDKDDIIEDNTNTDNNVEAPVQLNFFQRIWQAILNFFRNLFGGSAYNPVPTKANRL